LTTAVQRRVFSAHLRFYRVARGDV